MVRVFIFTAKSFFLGEREVFFNYNGTLRSTMVKDTEASKSIVMHPKASTGNLGSIGAPMPGEVIRLDYKVGDSVKKVCKIEKKQIL